MLGGKSVGMQKCWEANVSGCKSIGGKSVGRQKCWETKFLEAK